MSSLPSAPLTIVLFDSPEHQMTDEREVLLRVRNNADIDQSLWTKGPVIQASLPFHDNLYDQYTVAASVAGFRDTGDFVTANPAIHRVMKLLLIPSDQKLVFSAWSLLKQSHPDAAHFLGLGTDEAGAEARYAELQRDKPKPLACFLNLISAMADINLDGKTPLDFLKGICWDNTFAQDRFFGYADPAIIPAVVTAAGEGHFAEEPDPQTLHPGATLSYKQTDYDYSNVQLTFHQHDIAVIDGVECIRIEPDMDVYKDLLDHGLLELLPNLLSESLTNPIDILSLRWLDAVDDNQAPFDPGYTVV